MIYYWNYKLYLTGSKHGKDITQVLRTHPSYYEFDKILFIGDLDGDDIPDMVFEISGEDWTDIALYLSKSAKSDQLLKVTAHWTTTGC